MATRKAAKPRKRSPRKAGPKQTPAERVCARILELLDGDGPGNWKRAWKAFPHQWCPVNAETRRPYRGLNLLAMALAFSEGAYQHNAWLTYRQAEKLGGKVRKGEHGYPVIFWKRSQYRTENESGDEETRSSLLSRTYTVFNVAQCDGLPEDLLDRLTVPSRAPGKRIPEAHRLIRDSGAKIVKGSPAFLPSKDVIRMPPQGAFRDLDAYYATSFHELGHWTGHESRLDRPQTARFGTEAYAIEELIAELTSAIVCGSLGVNAELRHAQYVNSWLGTLRSPEGPKFLLSCASAAQKAADLIQAPAAALCGEAAE